MSKNLQKTLAGALATISAVSIATPVMATSVDVDTLYKNAYDAMVKAQETEKQTDINAAMDLIRQLRDIGVEKNDLHLINEANTWSSLVDKVQHPKLVKIVDAIVKAQDTGRQADINAAFATIEPELPASWKNSYTSALDLVQQELQDKLIVAVEKAENDRSEDSVKAARELVNEVLTSKNEAMVEWTKIFEDKLNNVIVKDENIDDDFLTEGEIQDGTAEDDYLVDEEVDDLNITDISVNRKQIKIEFTETTKSLDEVTLNILADIDDSGNNGKEIKVKPVTIIKKGDKEAIFEFVNYLSVEPTGIWNVNGVSFNLTEKAFVQEVKNANDSKNLEDILAKDEYKDLVTYNKANIAAYLVEIKNTESLKTVEDIQTIINKVNENNVNIDNEKDEVTYLNLLKETAKNGSDDQFLNALNMKFKNIDSKLINEYREAINKSKDLISLEDTQQKIDEINKFNNEAEVVTAKEELKTALVGENKEAILEALQNSLLGLKNVKAENIDHYVLDKANIKNKLEKHTGLEKVDEYLNMINEKADVINAANLKDMVTALGKFAQTRNLGDFNNLSTVKKQDTAEELLNILLLEQKEYNIGDLEKEVVSVNKIVETKLGKLKTALDNLAEKRGDKEIATMKEEDKTADLRTALKEIIGKDISVVQADAFYDNSINNGKVKTYTNYTDVRTVFYK